MRTLTSQEIREHYRITTHAAAQVEQDELGPSKGRVNEPPRVRVLPAWLQRGRVVSRTLARTQGGDGSEAA